MPKPARECEPLPKGSWAIAHIQKMAYHLHTGRYHWTRFYIVRVESADRDGRVKTFTSGPGAARKVDRFTTIYSIPPDYLPSAPALYAQQAVDFTGYLDKEHLRLCLVNRAIRDNAQRVEA